MVLQVESSRADGAKIGMRRKAPGQNLEAGRQEEEFQPKGPTPGLEKLDDFAFAEETFAILLQVGLCVLGVLKQTRSKA